jgi:serine/threonine-protein kinase RsbW
MSNESRTWRVEQVIPSDLSAGKRVLADILTRLHESEWEEDDIFGVHLSLEEAIVNAIKHGNRLDVAKQVRIAYELSSCELRVEICDEGPGFNPEQIPDCTRDDNLDNPSGRGIMLMRTFMSTVEYNDAGNRVTMCKQRTLPG